MRRPAGAHMRDTAAFVSERTALEGAASVLTLWAARRPGSGSGSGPPSPDGPLP